MVLQRKYWFLSNNFFFLTKPLEIHFVQEIPSGPCNGPCMGPVRALYGPCMGPVGLRKIQASFFCVQCVRGVNVISLVFLRLACEILPENTGMLDTPTRTVGGKKNRSAAQIQEALSTRIAPSPLTSMLATSQELTGKLISHCPQH